MPRSAIRVLGLAAALLVAAPGLAFAQAQVDFEVTIVHASPQPGPIDPSAQRLHQMLRKQFRYQSLRVKKQASVRAKVDEIKDVSMPTGRRLRLRPTNVTRDAALVEVVVEGKLDASFRMKNRKLVVIGGPSFEGGTLVILVDPRF